MLFEFIPDTEFNFIEAFARSLKVATDGYSLLVPERLGNGSIRRINLAPEFQLLVHRYQLREELVIKRITPPALTGAIRILFNTQQHLPVLLLRLLLSRLSMKRNPTFALTPTTWIRRCVFRLIAKSTL